jgi:hypothetical protein
MIIGAWFLVEITKNYSKMSVNKKNANGSFKGSN